MKLTQQQIVTTALALLDAEGLDQLNMRALARRLSVQPSALYWHVADKAELLTLMANSFYGRAYSGVADGLRWRQWLQAYGHSFRNALLTHRDAARLCAVAVPSRDARQSTDLLAAALTRAGLSRKSALSYIASVISLALGWAIYEQSEALHRHLAEMIGFDESFATGLAAMVAGFPGTKPTGRTRNGKTQRADL